MQFDLAANLRWTAKSSEFCLRNDHKKTDPYLILSTWQVNGSNLTNDAHAKICVVLAKQPTFKMLHVLNADFNVMEYL